MIRDVQISSSRQISFKGYHSILDINTRRIFAGCLIKISHCSTHLLHSNISFVSKQNQDTVRPICQYNANIISCRHSVVINLVIYQRASLFSLVTLALGVLSSMFWPMNEIDLYFPPRLWFPSITYCKECKSIEGFLFFDRLFDQLHVITIITNRVFFFIAFVDSSQQCALYTAYVNQ